MNKKLTYCIALIVAIILSGCEYDQKAEPKVIVKPKPVVVTPNVPKATSALQCAYTSATTITSSSKDWLTANYILVSLKDTSKGKIELDNGLLNCNGTYNGLSQFNGGKAANLKIRSIHNDTYIYILAEWSDATADLSGRVKLWNGPKDLLRPSSDTTKWTTQKNDDKFTVKFPLPSNINYKNDVWIWSASLSDPLGYAFDMAINTDNTLISDAGTPIVAQNGIGSKGNPAFEWSGEIQTVTKGNGSKAILDPTYFLYKSAAFKGNPVNGQSLFNHACSECHGINGTGIGWSNENAHFPFNKPELNAYSRLTLYDDITNVDHDGSKNVPSFSSQDFDDLFAFLRGQSGVPFYMLQLPTGSAADVIVTSSPNTGQGYKILIQRKLITNNTDDIQFDPTPGKAYTINFSLSDNDSINYIGSNDQIIEFKKTWE